MQAQPYGTNDFALMVPGGWKRQAVFTFLGPVVDTVQQCIVLTQDTLESETTAEAYTDEQLVQLKTELRKFSLQERSTLDVRGEQTPIALYQWKPQKTKAVSQVVVFFLRFPFVWTLTGTTAVGKEEDFLPTYNAMAQSFISRIQNQ